MKNVELLHLNNNDSYNSTMIFYCMHFLQEVSNSKWVLYSYLAKMTLILFSL